MSISSPFSVRREIPSTDIKYHKRRELEIFPLYRIFFFSITRDSLDPIESTCQKTPLRPVGKLAKFDIFWKSLNWDSKVLTWNMRIWMNDGSFVANCDDVTSRLYPHDCNLIVKRSRKFKGFGSKVKFTRLRSQLSFLFAHTTGSS